MVNEKTKTLKEFVTLFGPDLKPILEEKILDIKPKLDKKKKELDEIVANRRKKLYEKLIAEKVAKEKWAEQWELIYLLTDWGLKREISLLEAEYSNVMRALRLMEPEADELDVEAAKQYPILDLVKTKIYNRGRLKAICCPFHDEDSPSCFIYPNNTFYCYGCNKGGDVIDFIKLRDGLSFTEAVKSLL